MATLPGTQEGLLTFVEDHVAVWVNDPAAIGLDLSAVTALQGAVTSARSAYTVASAARETSKGATTALHGELDTLKGLAGQAINTIRAFAEGAADPMAVYAAAQIPPRADPTPAPAPATPTDASATLLGDGTIRLRWKAPQPAAGAEVYTQIRRRLGTTGPFTTLGDTGEKTFVDDTVPAGTAEVQYTFIAKRNGQSSDPTQPITLLLGVPALSALAVAGHT
ncbi:MAG: hypothetical protein ACF8R7_04800, partial [Phycisphaerales bacterium JB039]